MLRLLNFAAGCSITLDGEGLFLFWCLISAAIGLVLHMLHHILVRARHGLLAELLQVLVHIVPRIHLTALILKHKPLMVIGATLKLVICC